MKIFWLVIFVLCLGMATQSQAQQGGVTGNLYAESAPLSYANILIKDTSIGAISDETGRFEIKGLTSGVYDLEISAIGYRRIRKSITIMPDRTLNMGRIEILPDQFALDAVVVTGTMKESYVKSSPLKVEVFKGKFLQSQLAPTNLIESIGMLNGAQEVVACGVCGTNSISLNGLPGAYTAVLLDGSPIYGNLASVYGLNGIPSSIIEQLELVKGPQSTLYGSEAMAGVINIITKKPEDLHRVNFDLAHHFFRGGLWKFNLVSQKRQRLPKWIRDWLCRPGSGQE